MTTYVDILESFEETIPLGALVVKTFGGSDYGAPVEQVVDGPREFVARYTSGEAVRFRLRKDAVAFVAKHPGKAQVRL
jgi:hypothetical protein